MDECLSVDVATELADEVKQGFVNLHRVEGEQVHGLAGVVFASGFTSGLAHPVPIRPLRQIVVSQRDQNLVSFT
jgi:hypothetical protein